MERRWKLTAILPYDAGTQQSFFDVEFLEPGFFDGVKDYKLDFFEGWSVSGLANAGRGGGIRPDRSPRGSGHRHRDVSAP